MHGIYASSVHLSAWDEDCMSTMPYDERDEESGQFTPEFPDEDFVDAARGGTTTSDVADAVGCKYRTAYARLTDLEDEGRVTSQKVGNSLLWDAVDGPDRDGTVREHRETADDTFDGQE